YTSRHVRLHRDVTIGVRVGGVPEDWWQRCGTVVPLGGEARWSEQRPWAGDACLEPPLSEILDTRRAMLVALTPIHAGDEFFRPGGRLEELGDATVVSACLPRVERIGGWASVGDRPGPVSMCSVLPAGSVVFCEIGDPDGLAAAVERADGPLRVGGGWGRVPDGWCGGVWGGGGVWGCARWAPRRGGRRGWGGGRGPGGGGEGGEGFWGRWRRACGGTQRRSDVKGWMLGMRAET